MAKNTPAFQFYPADFLGGTMTTSDAATGVYIKLLCAMWVAGGSLPNCTTKLAICAQTTPEKFEAVWVEIQDKFVIATDEKTISNEKLNKVQKTQRVKATAGSKGGKVCQKNAQKKQAKREQSAPIKSEERRLKDEEQRTENEDLWIIPKNLDTPQVRSELAEFEKMRRRKKNPIRSRSNTSRILKKFDSVEHLLYALDVVISNEYTGLKPDYRPTGPAAKSAPKTVEKKSREIKLGRDRDGQS